MRWQELRRSGNVVDRRGTRGGPPPAGDEAGHQQVYIDLSFHEDLRTRFAVPGDLAQACVIAHEVGHPVRHLLGNSQACDTFRADAQ